MVNGRIDEQETPPVTGAYQRRNTVWGLLGETHLGQRSFVPRQTGRTHDRTRSVYQIKQKVLASLGSSTHVSIIEDAGREMASFFLLGKVNRSYWRRLSAKWSVLIVLLVLLAVFGLLWPPLTDLPPYQALEATTAYLVLWVIAAGYLIHRYGWKNLSVIVMLPCLLMWPTMCLLIM